VHYHGKSSTLQVIIWRGCDRLWCFAIGHLEGLTKAQTTLVRMALFRAETLTWDNQNTNTYQLQYCRDGRYYYGAVWFQFQFNELCYFIHNIHLCHRIYRPVSHNIRLCYRVHRPVPHNIGLCYRVHKGVPHKTETYGHIQRQVIHNIELCYRIHRPLLPNIELCCHVHRPVPHSIDLCYRIHGSVPSSIKLCCRIHTAVVQTTTSCGTRFLCLYTYAYARDGQNL
jgi:hypothetical protein